MLKTIKSISKYFKKDTKNKSLTFTGKKLIVRIPKRYEVYNLLNISNTVSTLGILDLEFNDKERASLMMLSTIGIIPSDTREEVIGGLTYLVLELEQGDTFIEKTDVIQDSTIAYAMFVEFISYGKLPYFIGHDEAAFIFDTAKEMTGANLDIDHVIFELINAHLSRDPDDINMFYRHTTMSKKSHRIMLRSVAHGPESTSAKLLGSYFGDGMTSALIEDIKHQHHIEDLLRI